MSLDDGQLNLNVAMVTILAGEFPVWMQGPYTQQVYQFGWKYSGQVYIVFGTVAVVLHSAPRFGFGKALALAGEIAANGRLAVRGAKRAMNALARIEEELPPLPELRYLVEFIRASDRGVSR